MSNSCCLKNIMERKDKGLCFVIAEIGQAHDGSLGSAHAYIDAVAKSGVNAVKFQTHIAKEESTPHEKFRVNCFPQDKTRYDYWQRMEFTEDQWKELYRHATEKGLVFLSTPFSFAAVELLDRIGMECWKISSGEIGNLPLLERIANTQKPVLLSTGMSPWKEVEDAVNLLERHNNDYAVLQCTTSYPCPPEKVGLNVLGELRERFSCPVGLSDHSGSIFPGLAAATMGANFLEVHAVFSKDCFGPDVLSSITISKLTEMVEGIRFIEKSLSNPVDKDEFSETVSDLKELFGRSVYAKSKLPRGHKMTLDDVALKKPGGGIPANNLHSVIGKTLRKDIFENELIKESDFDA